MRKLRERRLKELDKAAKTRSQRLVRQNASAARDKRRTKELNDLQARFDELTDKYEWRKKQVYQLRKNELEHEAETRATVDGV